MNEVPPPERLIATSITDKIFKFLFRKCLVSFSRPKTLLTFIYLYLHCEPLSRPARTAGIEGRTKIIKNHINRIRLRKGKHVHSLPEKTARTAAYDSGLERIDPGTLYREIRGWRTTKKMKISSGCSVWLSEDELTSHHDAGGLPRPAAACSAARRQEASDPSGSPSQIKTMPHNRLSTKRVL